MIDSTTRGQRQSAPSSGWRALGRFFGLLLVLVVLVAPVAATVDVIASARSYDEQPTDAIVVLGASQYWGEPSPVLRNRLDHAEELWREGVAPVIVTVGGKQPGDNTTEAEVGRDYLVSRGVPADSVVALPTGTDTVESIESVRDYLEPRGASEVTIVSDRLHLARSKAIASALGLDPHVSGRAFEDGSSFAPDRVLRETAGLLKFHFLDRWQLA